MKTQQEIRARFDEIRAKSSDFFGWRQEALIECMEFETAKDLVREGTTAEDWHEVDPARTARDYLSFAIGKAIDHRGLSAGRSVEKLSEWLWVIDDTELADKFEMADYYPYGAPQLAVLADAWNIEQTDADWLRMREGKPCEDDCLAGC